MCSVTQMSLKHSSNKVKLSECGGMNPITRFSIVRQNETGTAYCGCYQENHVNRETHYKNDNRRKRRI